MDYSGIRRAMLEYEVTMYEPPRSRTAAACVKRGVAMLDATLPGWWSRLEAENLIIKTSGQAIDLDSLDMESTTQCVLGQLFNNAFPGAAGFGWVGLRRPKAFGFDTSWMSGEASYGELTRLWRKAIEARRKAEASHDA